MKLLLSYVITLFSQENVYRSLFLSFILIASTSLLIGQNVKGTVSDEEGRPVPSAEIINLHNGHHTHTDAKGQFETDHVHIGDSIKAVSIGFKTQYVIIKSYDEVLNIVMSVDNITLGTVVIPQDDYSLNYIATVDMQMNPVNSSQEVLQQVPGLMIGQHAGGGKAEQLFLRGFDIDHGTDVRIDVDGMPVNMVSHAHGQGYADLHFVIPEVIKDIDFGKGTYYADKGDFTTAGYVSLRTKESLKANQISVEAGQFDSYRLLGMFDIINNTKSQCYLASEYQMTNGPFDSPQNFSRLNIFGKYTTQLSASERLAVSVSHFTSEWDASGQIPERSVKSGAISRFGAIDDTEGGQTSRSNLNFEYVKEISEKAFISNQVYFNLYDFDLFSNFTFFLEDSVNGDQIQQYEERKLFGINSTYNHFFVWDNASAKWRTGISLRNDRSRENQLAHTLNRDEVVEQYMFGDIHQNNAAVFTDLNIIKGKWAVNPALRLDLFSFSYKDNLLATYNNQSEQELILSPKLNILYNLNSKTQFYLKTGKGFHSNDSRVVVAQGGAQILPASYGADLGLALKPSRKLLLNAAFWYLYLEQEFVYVGDAGVVEPSGRTRRFGVDLDLRYQPLEWFYADADFTYANAGALDEPDGEDYIPLAPIFTFTGGLHVKHKSGLHAGLRWRFMHDRPANEDNSITAEGYTVFDLNVGYKRNNIRYGIQVLNLLNTEWNETQFATESRLATESESVEEIHFTPGTPLAIKGRVDFFF